MVSNCRTLPLLDRCWCVHFLMMARQGQKSRLLTCMGFHLPRVTKSTSLYTQESLYIYMLYKNLKRVNFLSRLCWAAPFQLMSGQPRGQTWPMSISSWSVLGGGTASSVSLRKCFPPQCTCRSFKKKHSCSTAVMSVGFIVQLQRCIDCICIEQKTSWVPTPPLSPG